MQQPQSISILLANLFISGAANPEHAQLKKTSLERLHETFPVISEQNVAEYCKFLQEWTLHEADDSNLELFVRKLKELNTYLGAFNNPKLHIELLTITYYLLQQESEAVRSNALDITCGVLATPDGSVYIKNTVKSLIEKSDHYHGFDSALVLFGRFKERFEDNEYVYILTHDNLYKTYRIKKILSNHIIKLAMTDLTHGLLVVLSNIAAKLMQDEDEVICVNGLKCKILLNWQAVQRGIASSANASKDILPFYSSSLVRVRFTLLELTKYIVEFMPCEEVEMHFRYMQSNITPEEPEISELAISQLRCIFRRVSMEGQKELLSRLLSSHHNTQFQETIAKHVIDLLINVENEAELLNFLDNFMKIQQDHVKLTLLKSFFRHEKCIELYKNFRPVLQQLHKNCRWRTRLQSLQILEKLLEIIDVFDDQLIKRLYELIILDSAYRVRINAIKLVLPYIQNPRIQNLLIPMILKQYTNCSYLVRLTVLHFIQQTYSLMSNPAIFAGYNNILSILEKDKVQNVAEVAHQFLERLSKC